MDKGPDKPALGEIEITEEMIEAGIAAYERWYARGGADDNAIAELVRDVIRTAIETGS